MLFAWIYQAGAGEPGRRGSPTTRSESGLSHVAHGHIKPVIIGQFEQPESNDLNPIG